jgi:hypothetical protein
MCPPSGKIQMLASLAGDSTIIADREADADHGEYGEPINP